MIVEDVAVVTVIVLFAWLVPVRRNGIPGLGGRGRIPAHRAPRHGPARHGAFQGPGRSATRPLGRAVLADPAQPAVTATRPEPVRPRPVPTTERTGAADAAKESMDRNPSQAGQAGRPGGRDREQDERVLAELDKTWEAGYADRVAAQLRGKGRR